MNKLFRTAALALAGFSTLLVAAPARAQQMKAAAPVARSDEFFIVSSVDTPKHQIVLKRPTEVTMLMRVNDQTSYLDENGKSLHLSDLRAGDTVYISWKPEDAGAPTALRIRKGIMTVAELHKRYLGY